MPKHLTETAAAAAYVNKPAGITDGQVPVWNATAGTFQPGTGGGGGTGGAVSSVAGRTGDVVLAKADVGLANVDNTADSAKPVSTAQQAAADKAASRLMRAVDFVPVISYGDSYVAALGATDTDHGFATRFAKEVNANINTLFGKSGTTLGQTVAGMVGDTSQSGIVWNVGNRGLVVLKNVINSVINIPSSGDAQEKIGYQNHLRTFLRIVRCGAWIAETDASCVYTGTWSAASVNKTKGGTAKKTSTSGDKVTITTTASEITLMMLGFPTNTGTSFSVTVNGSAYAAEISNTGNSTTALTSDSGGLWYPISVRVAGLSGTSTVVLTNTSTGDFYFDGYLTKSPTPIPVIVCKEATPTVAGLQINGADTNRTAANLAIFNGYIDSICGSAEFNDGLVKVADPQPYYDNTTMENPATRPHPNNIGHQMYAYAIQQVARTFGFSTGLNL